VVDDTDPRHIWRGIGRGLDQCYPPDREQVDNTFDDLLDALRQKDQSKDASAGA